MQPIPLKYWLKKRIVTQELLTQGLSFKAWTLVRRALAGEAQAHPVQRCGVELWAQGVQGLSLETVQMKEFRQTVELMFDETQMWVSKRLVRVSKTLISETLGISQCWGMSSSCYQLHL